MTWLEKKGGLNAYISTLTKHSYIKKVGHVITALDPVLHQEGLI